MFILRAEGYSCSLDVLSRGLGLIKLQFLIKKIQKKFHQYFFLRFLIIKTLDPDTEPDPDSMNQ
jgi:hypothetical protein